MNSRKQNQRSPFSPPARAADEGNAEPPTIAATGSSSESEERAIDDSEFVPVDQIENYSLTATLGEGGFGTVYEATQHAPVQRQVAIKIIKAGMNSEEVLRRFELEKQALARMDHPNIARVFDAGTTTGGRPYFVMELIRGIPITTYCDSRRLDLGQRLKLFLQVCAGIQHAHQKGIIHRDIKPSNILIIEQDDVPTARVIDFGIARAVTQEEVEQPAMTGRDQIIGTPLYMSPEQIEMNSGDLDTRSDVFGLGVVLYELLTGSTPVEPERVKTAGIIKLHQIMVEETPPKPSSKLIALSEEDAATVASLRNSAIVPLRRRIGGDLDWISMRAMEVERDRRYQTVRELGDDIGRHLKHEPVTASPPSTSYRISRFVRRNRAATIAAATVLVTLVCGGSFSAWKAWQATQARNSLQSALEDSESAVAEMRSQIARFQAGNQPQVEELEARLQAIEKIRSELASLDGKLAEHRERNGLLVARLEGMRRAQDEEPTEIEEGTLTKAVADLERQMLEAGIDSLEAEVEEETEVMSQMTAEKESLLRKERDLILELKEELSRSMESG